MAERLPRAVFRSSQRRLSLQGIVERYDLKRQVVAVENCRSIGKKDMKNNSAMPKIEVNPDTYQVTVDGELATCEPASVLPLAQRYFLF